MAKAAAKPKAAQPVAGVGEAQAALDALKQKITEGCGIPDVLAAVDEVGEVIGKIGKQ
jgi:hypothetical protein